MRAAVAGVLAVHEREVVLAEAVRVREADLEVLLAVVDRLVDLLELRLVGHQVQQAVVGAEGLAVEVDREAGVEVGGEADAALDELRPELVSLEDRRVGGELHVGAVSLVGATLGLVHEQAPLELDLGELAVAHGAGEELRGEGVDGLRADAVHADGELEDVVVELAAGVELAHALAELAEGDAAAVVAAGDGLLVDRELDLAAEAGNELVDGVVEHLLEEDVDAVHVVGAVALAPDVHAEAQADVLQSLERLDGRFVVCFHGPR